MSRHAWSLVLLALLSGPALAQSPAPNCLFPLACPGPVPPKPAPLYGTPEEQAATQPIGTAKPKHAVHRRVTKAKAKAQ